MMLYHFLIYQFLEFFYLCRYFYHEFHLFAFLVFSSFFLFSSFNCSSNVFASGVILLFNGIFCSFLFFWSSGYFILNSSIIFSWSYFLFRNDIISFSSLKDKFCAVLVLLSRFEVYLPYFLLNLDTGASVFVALFSLLLGFPNNLKSITLSLTISFLYYIFLIISLFFFLSCEGEFFSVYIFFIFLSEFKIIFYYFKIFISFKFITFFFYYIIK